MFILAAERTWNLTLLFPFPGEVIIVTEILTKNSYFYSCNRLSDVEPKELYHFVENIIKIMYFSTSQLPRKTCFIQING